MICDYCRRDVEFTKASFWHGDANICRECLSRWYDPDNDQVNSTDPVSIGNHVRLRHGLPPLAAAAAIFLFAFTPASHASRHCLDQAEAARTWPARALAMDEDGCWTYDHHSPPAEAPVSMPEQPAETRDAALSQWWLESELVQAELRKLELEPASRPEPPSPQGPNLSVRHLALFVALVLATVSVLEVATWRPGGPARPRWPQPRSRN